MIKDDVLIVGSGGIGCALALRMCELATVKQVILSYRNNKPEISHPKLYIVHLDANDEMSVEALLGDLKPKVVINTIGILHDDNNRPEKSISQFSQEWFVQSHLSNAATSLNLAKAIHHCSSRKDAVLFAALSARVGSISDNRSGGWYAYRASKSSLNMALTCLSLEWKRARPNHCVLLLHPGTVDTQLSEPFQAHVPSHKLFRPEQCAQYLLNNLEKATPELSGQFLAWDGQEIPW